MKTVKVPISDDGKPIVNGSDGFIVQGNIYSAELDECGNPCGGFIGSGVWLDKFTEEQIKDIPIFCMDKKSFIKALYFTKKELQEIVDLMPNDK